MKLVEINSGFHGSTGTIMLDIAEAARAHGWEAHTFSAPKPGSAPRRHRYFGSKAENLLHRALSVFSGISGKGSTSGTRQLLRELEQIQPDILHLHNLHGWYINLPLLFDYIRKNNLKTIWTLHDCWAFTAQCSHFTMEQCEKWKSGCHTCPRYRLYPYTYVDRTKTMWGLKKEWFAGVKQLTLVTPSEWLAEHVRHSFLQEYPVQVIHNGIDTESFKPTESDFRERYGLQGKKVVLGVASAWNERKGLDVLLKLSCNLGSEYRVVLVGTDAEVDKKLPEGIISIHRTTSRSELAQIYSAADVFANPTREENFPTVNIESLACGTPVVTFATGGSAEMLTPGCGAPVPYGDADAMEEAIRNTVCSTGAMREACVRQAQKFNKQDAWQEYVNLYTATLSQKGGC